MATATVPDTTAKPMPVEADAKPDALSAIAGEQMLPAHLLDGGEIVILAIKPSLWFVPIRSGGFVLATALLACIAWLAADRTRWVPPALVVQVAVTVAAARLGIAAMAWVSRLYVLTNRRIMRIRGVFNIDLFECPLTKIQHMYLRLTLYERLLGLGSISFATAGTGGVEVSWRHVPNPAHVHEEVRAAIRRARGGNEL